MSVTSRQRKLAAFDRCPDIVETQSWVVVFSQPGKEIWAADNLRRLGYPCYLPRILQTVRHARRSHRKLVPLFPRHLFAAIDPLHDAWNPILGVSGVAALIMGRGRPQTMPRPVLETLAAASDGAGSYDFETVFGGNRQVHCLTGPVARDIGKLSECKGPDRVKVLFNILESTGMVESGTSKTTPAPP